MERNLFILILLITSLLGGEQFVFWAKFSSKNHFLTGQKLSLSPLMVPIEKKGALLCHINEKKAKKQSTYEYLGKNKEALLECFAKKNVQVYDVTREKSFQANSNTEVIIAPIRFTVDFKDEFANIYLLLRD